MAKALVSEYDCGYRTHAVIPKKLQNASFGTQIDDLLPKLDKEHDKHCEACNAKGESETTISTEEVPGLGETLDDIEVPDDEENDPILDSASLAV